MLCRSLRNLLVGRWILVGLLGAALVVGAGVCAPIAPAEDGPASVSLRAPEFPLAALESTSPVRLEKQAQPNRLTFPKPDRTAQPSWVERLRVTQPRRQASRTAHVLPRRVLPSRKLTSRHPSDSGEPFLVSSPLS
jgi:hypothetical protein